MTDKNYKTQSGIIHYLTNDIHHDRKTLVFLPGLTADHRLFDKQIEYFSEHNNVFVWDAPGHASSWPFSFKFDLSNKARWLDEILTTEGIEKPILVGQSMGGYVVRAYCELFPEKIGGFVAIDSAPLQRKFTSAWEIWLLKRMESIYRHWSWKSLLSLAEEDYCEAITAVQQSMDKYEPSVIGYEWDNDNPRIQLEPRGERGYIELKAVKRKQN